MTASWPTLSMWRTWTRWPAGPSTTSCSTRSSRSSSAIIRVRLSTLRSRPVTGTSSNPWQFSIKREKRNSWITIRYRMFMTSCYSLSDLNWLTVFFPLFPTKSLFLPSKLGKPLRSTTACMYRPTFCLNSAKCWFCSLGPKVKFDHCQQLPTVQTREVVIIGNGWILLWDLMSKINILQSWDKKYVYKHAR